MSDNGKQGRGGSDSPLPTETMDELELEQAVGSDARISRRAILKSSAALGALTLGSGSAAAFDMCEEFPSLPVCNGDGLPGGGSGPDCPLVGNRTDDSNLPFSTSNYGGWGGHEAWKTDAGNNHTPVVFAHGNTRDACDWNGVAGYLQANDDYLGDDLWSITFGESTTSHAEMQNQFEDFVANILDYTGASQVDVAAHSLGVTGARYWMDQNDRYDTVNTFVGMAGANHGVCTCSGCSAGFGVNEVCQFIAQGCTSPGQPLYDLNNPDETPGDVDYYTIRASSDSFYSCDGDSPRLEGANENIVVSGGHDNARTSSTSKQKLVQWLD